jgi:hypothetical protein
MDAARKHLERLEHPIRSAMAPVNQHEIDLALAEIHDQRLYRATHASWEAYCSERLHWARRWCDTRIQAAKSAEPGSGVSIREQAGRNAAKRRRCDRFSRRWTITSSWRWS